MTDPDGLLPPPMPGERGMGILATVLRVAGWGLMVSGGGLALMQLVPMFEGIGYSGGYGTLGARGLLYICYPLLVLSACVGGGGLMLACAAGLGWMTETSRTQRMQLDALFRLQRPA